MCTGCSEISGNCAAQRAQFMLLGSGGIEHKIDGSCRKMEKTETPIVTESKLEVYNVLVFDGKMVTIITWQVALTTK